MLVVLEKQQYSIDQLKQYITTLKKMAQSINESNLKSPSIGSNYGAIYNRGVTPEINEHEL